MVSKAYLVKVDISGIQNFIFDIKSDGAARALKSKSVFVLMLGKYIVQTFMHVFENTIVLYEGGGNALLKINSNEDQLIKVITYFNKFKEDGLNIVIAYIEYNKVSFAKLNQNLHSKISFLKNRPKLRKQKFSRSISLKWEDYAKFMLDKQNFSYPLFSLGNEIQMDVNIDELDNDPVLITPKSGHRNLDFTEIATDSDIKGADYLGALKMDLDNLGRVFEKVENPEIFQIISKIISRFFKEYINNLINKRYKNKVYVIFSGGDDCFFIGKWSIMIELAIEIKNQFNQYLRNSTLNNEYFKKIDLNNVTISASLIITSHKYPMSKIGQHAENELHKAKYKSLNKNSVSVFGYVLTWKELNQALELKNLLVELVEEKGESRSLIQYVIKSHKGFEPLLQKAQRGSINIPKVWRLKYYLRNISNKNYKEVDKIFREYESAILNAFLKKETINPDLYIVAARWAELLIKNKESL